MDPRLVIDRLEIGLTGFDAGAAQAVQEALPGALSQALQRTLAQRLATAGLGSASLQLGHADLGTLDLPARVGPQAAAEAIAAQLAGWLQLRLADPPAQEA